MEHNKTNPSDPASNPVDESTHSMGAAERAIIRPSVDVIDGIGREAFQRRFDRQDRAQRISATEARD